MAPKTKALMNIKKETADLVLSKVQYFQGRKELDLPPNYSAANALKSAWLILQDTLDKDKRPALEVCTKHSIANCLLDMVIQGLNPAKKQCYFIAYGQSLTMQRSYFGTKAVAMRVCPQVADIFAELIYEGDKVEISIERGQRKIDSHKTQFANIDDSKIAGAYATAIDKDGNVLRTEFMTMDQIKKAWAQSQMKPVLDNGNLKAGSTHDKFTGEMAKKTVTSRLAKHFINSSDDADLVVKSVKRTDDAVAESEADEEADEFANLEVIDIDTGDHESEEDDAAYGEAYLNKPEIKKAQAETNQRISKIAGDLSAEEQEEIRQAEMAEAIVAATEGRGPSF
jgi:recombination protein RecT